MSATRSSSAVRTVTLGEDHFAVEAEGVRVEILQLGYTPDGAALYEDAHGIRRIGGEAAHALACELVGRQVFIR
ncbi:MAG TPA: hypothetical protein VG963_14095 [Polyangiaceae bacterium]|nr:hypothetical protein [Polyangiaceae bacterium]